MLGIWETKKYRSGKINVLQLLKKVEITAILWLVDTENSKIAGKFTFYCSFQKLLPLTLIFNFHVFNNHSQLPCLGERNQRYIQEWYI